MSTKRLVERRTPGAPSAALPTYMKAKNCEYVPLDEIDPFPEGVIGYFRWSHGEYDRAYRIGDDWFIAWDDRSMPAPEAVQCRKGVRPPIDKTGEN